MPQHHGAFHPYQRGRIAVAQQTIDNDHNMSDEGINIQCAAEFSTPPRQKQMQCSAQVTMHPPAKLIYKLAPGLNFTPRPTLPRQPAETQLARPHPHNLTQ
jgi:hypothetical protein